MREIKIKEFIIRVDESTSSERASLVGLDEEGNEYQFKTYDSHDLICQTDIIVTEKNEDLLTKDK